MLLYILRHASAGKSTMNPKKDERRPLDEAVMVVGHNPSLTEFLSKSVSGAGGSMQIDFRKGAVARVEMNGRTGTLDWLVTPKIARTLQTSLKSSSRPKTSRK